MLAGCQCAVRWKWLKITVQPRRQLFCDLVWFSIKCPKTRNRQGHSLRQADKSSGLFLCCIQVQGGYSVQQCRLTTDEHTWAMSDRSGPRLLQKSVLIACTYPDPSPHFQACLSGWENYLYSLPLYNPRCSTHWSLLLFCLVFVLIEVVSCECFIWCGKMIY